MEGETTDPQAASRGAGIFKRFWRWLTSPENPGDKTMNAAKRIVVLLTILAAPVALVAFVWDLASSETTSSSDSTTPAGTIDESVAEPTTVATSPADTLISSTAKQRAKSFLEATEDLDPGQVIVSDDGKHVLEMTTDGYLAATTDGRVWWASPNVVVPGAVAAMQRDGNLVIYPSTTDRYPGDDLWNTGTGGPENLGYMLVIGDQDGFGYIEIYSPALELAIWRVEDEKSE